MAFHNAQTPEDLPYPVEPERRLVCAWCSSLYWEQESDATVRTRLCSSECETEEAAEDAENPEVDPRVKGDDDGQEYGDPRDEQIDRLLR